MPEIIVPSGSGESFMAYVAFPAQLPAPAVIVAQEIFGVNAGMRAKCDILAAEGFVAICPDLFWRIEPGVQLTDRSEAEWKKAFSLHNAFDIDAGIEDLKTTMEFIRQHENCAGPVGCIGYCLGGKLAYLMACRSEVDATVGYYGVGLENLLDEAKGIQKPVLLHIAEEDRFVSKDAQAEIISALSPNPHVTLYSYPGANHAFSRVGGQHYDPAAAELADARTFSFLRDHLAELT